MADKTKVPPLSEAEINVLMYIRQNPELAFHLRELHDWAIHFNIQPVEDDQKSHLYHTSQLGKLLEKVEKAQASHGVL